MKTKSLILFVLMFSLFAHAFAQADIRFFSKESADGKPGEELFSMVKDPGPEMIRILISNSDKPLPANARLEIALLKNYVFHKVDEKKVEPKPGETEFSIPYSVNQVGDYRFRLYSNEGVQLAEGILAVSESMQEHSSAQENSDTSSNDPGAETEVTFTDLLDEKDNGINSEFSFRKLSGKVYMCLEPAPKEGTALKIEIWKKETGESYGSLKSDEVVNWPSKANGKNGCQSLNFPSIGDYKLNIYRYGGKLLTSAYIQWK